MCTVVPSLYSVIVRYQLDLTISRLEMASSASGVTITVSPTAQDVGEHSQTSLVRSQETRADGVRQDRRSSNGFLVHEISEGDTDWGLH